MCHIVSNGDFFTTKRHITRSGRCVDENKRFRRFFEVAWFGGLFAGIMGGSEHDQDLVLEGWFRMRIGVSATCQVSKSSREVGSS